MTDRTKRPLRTRRSMFYLGLSAFVTSFAALLGGMGRFFFPKVLFEPKTRFTAGSPDDYPEGTVSEKHKDDQRVWIVHTEDGIYAIEALCTHLGCTPNWFPEEGLFKCPCHGSNFNLDGDVVAGPAPEPLYRVQVRVDQFNKLVVDKAVKANRTGRREAEPFMLRI